MKMDRTCNPISLGNDNRRFLKKMSCIFDPLIYLATLQQLSTIGVDGFITNDVAGAINALTPSLSPAELTDIPLTTTVVVLIALGTLVVGVGAGIAVMYIIVRRAQYVRLKQ